MKILIVDTETTGLSSTDEAIEIGLSLYEINSSDYSAVKASSYTGRRCPSVPINPRAQQVHKISLSELLGKDFDHKEVNSLLNSADILVAHNASFDARMLEPLYPDIKNFHWRCTLKQWPWPLSSGKSLASIATDLNISRLHAHTADGDVDILSACLFYPEANGQYLKNLIESGDYSFKESFGDSFKRAANAISPEAQHASKSLLDIIAAIISDKNLHDSEIEFLNNWIKNSPISTTVWPGNILAERLNKILADGVIDEDERSNLLSILSEMINGTLKKVSDKVSEKPLPLDDVDAIDFLDHTFCLTGNFLLGLKDTCELKIKNRGGSVTGSITKKLDYLIIGSLGSDQWKHGNYGTKVEKALEYKLNGIPIKIIHEETLSKFL
jgi:DNA polymerase III epsilon subunit-like protein